MKVGSVGEPVETKGEGGKGYMSHFLKAGHEEPEGRGEKGENMASKFAEAKVHFSNMLKTKEKSLDQGDGQKEKCLDKEERPLSQMSAAESVKSRASSVKSYVSNIMKSRTEDADTEADNTIDKAEEQKFESKVSFSTSLKDKGSSVKSYMSKLMQPKPKKSENENAEPQTQNSKVTVTESFKSKSSVSTIFKSNPKVAQSTKEESEKIKKIKTYMKSKSSSLQTNVSSWTKKLKLPQKTINEGQVTGSKVSSWKTKCADAKNATSAMFERNKKEKTEHAGDSQAATVVDHLPGMFKSRDEDTASPGEKTETKKTKFSVKTDVANTSSVNREWNIFDKRNEDQRSEIDTKSSVREYVQRYESMSAADSRPSSATNVKGYSYLTGKVLQAKPFKEFNGDALSASSDNSLAASGHRSVKVDAQ